MSSKNSGTQGRRTPLTLNSQMKLSQQQYAPQGKRTPTSSNDSQDIRIKQSQQQQQPQPQQQQQQKKEEKKEVNVAASAAGPVPTVNVTHSNVQQVKPTSNVNNGHNGTETNGVANGNKSVNANDNKKEIETRNKVAKPAKVAEEQPKNGTDAATKETVANASGSASPSSRKQQQLQQKQEKEEQISINMKAPSTPTNKKQVEVKVETPKSSPSTKKVQNKQTNDVIVIDDKNDKIMEATNKTTPKKQVVASENSKKDETPNDQQQQQQKEKEKEKVDDVPVKSNVKPITTVASKASDETAIKVTPTKKISVTGTVDNEEMDTSPYKLERNRNFETVENPTATSTPGKPKAMGISLTPARPLTDSGRNLIITGRRSIRSFNDFANSSQCPGKYRQLSTDLDVTNQSNSSLNVTVGSEPGNNTSWFSFGSRKRERAAPVNTEIVQEQLLSPPKRARFGLFSIMASPITVLRSRFAKTSLDALETSKIEEQDEHNGSMDEDVSINEVEDCTPTTDAKENSPQKQTTAAIKEEEKKGEGDVADNCEKINISAEGADLNISKEENADISFSAANKRRCNVM